MASNIHQFLFVCIFIFIFIFLDFVSISSCQLFNGSIDNVGGSAVATWYGSRTGAGSGNISQEFLFDLTYMHQHYYRST